MDIFSAQWFSALVAIIVIDLVLAGDNAVVIALAARNLPLHLRQRAIVWGTAGAIVVRCLMTLVVVWLLQIPGLLLVGGLGLLWVAYKLVSTDEGEDEHGAASATFWGAMKTIVVADALMGIDNVLGVAGAAEGRFDLVVIGLLASVPIMVWGSSFVLRMIDRFPIIILGGGMLLGWVAGSMIATDPMISDPSVWTAFPKLPQVAWMEYAFGALGALLVVLISRLAQKSEQND